MVAFAACGSAPMVTWSVAVSDENPFEEDIDDVIEDLLLRGGVAKVESPQLAEHFASSDVVGTEDMDVEHELSNIEVLSEAAGGDPTSKGFAEVLEAARG